MTFRPLLVAAVFSSLVVAGYATWLKVESRRMIHAPWIEVEDAPGVTH